MFKKNAFLIKEGENIENIFFVKNGRLALEAAIDLDDIEKSIEKYLEYQFEDISSIEDSDFENSITKLQKFIVDDNEIQPKIYNDEELLEIIKKLSQNIGNNSYLHETNIEDEIGKCDFNEVSQDLEQGNHQFLHILDILKNEHFGELYMFLNKPCPLSLRVKSKKVDLFLLRKKDAINIKKDYPNIWKRIDDKEMHNMKSVKALTKKVIKRYCKINGIIQQKDIIERSNHLFEYKDSDFNKSRPKSPNSNINNFNYKILKKRVKRFHTTSLKKNKVKNKISDELAELSPIKKKEMKSFKTVIKNNKKEKKKEFSSLLKESSFSDVYSDKIMKENLEKKKEKNNRKEIKDNNNINKSSKKTYINLNESNKSLNEKINIKYKIKDINKEKENEKIDINCIIKDSNKEKNKDKNKENQIQNNENKDNQNKKNIILELSKLKEKSENNNISQSALTTKNIQTTNILNNEHLIINHNNSNNIISNPNLLFQIEESSNKINNSTSIRCTCTSRNFFNLIKENPINIEYFSSYKNVNKIAKGKYIKNKGFQNALYKFIKSYLKMKSKKKYNYKTSIFKFSSPNVNSKKTLYDKNISLNSEKEQNSNNEFSKEIEFIDNINNGEENENKNNIYKHNNKIHKVYTESNYHEQKNENKIIKFNSYPIKSEKNITKKYSFTQIKYNPKIFKKYNFKNDIDKYFINDKDNKSTNKKLINKDKFDIVKQNKIFNFNFHITDNDILINNEQKDINEKCNNDKINNNSSHHVINSNLNHIINETNYNYTKNYCSIY